MPPRTPPKEPGTVPQVPWPPRQRGVRTSGPAPSSVSAFCPFAPGAILSSGKSLDRALRDGPPWPSSILGPQSLLYICVLAALRHLPLLCPLTPAPFSRVNSRHCFLQEALHNHCLSTPYGRRPASGKQRHLPSTSCAPEAAGAACSPDPQCGSRSCGLKLGARQQGPLWLRGPAVLEVGMS